MECFAAFILNIIGQAAVVILIALLLARRECSLLLPPAADCLEAATTAWAIEQHGVKLATHHLRSARLEPRRLGHNVPVRQGDDLALRPEVDLRLRAVFGPKAFDFSTTSSSTHPRQKVEIQGVILAFRLSRRRKFPFD